MENHVSPIRCNTFDAISFQRQDFAVSCHQSSRTRTYLLYLHTKLMSSFKQQVKGNFIWFRCEKAKGNGLPCACNPALRGNWATYVQASDALTATSRMHNSNRSSRYHIKCLLKLALLP